MTKNLPRTLAGFALLLFVTAPAIADTQFRVKRMTRNDVPLGKGQCDIRLRVDNEAEISVRGDMVYVRTISGRDARDDGSECNEPLPARAVSDFNFEVRDRRGDIALLSEPTQRSGNRAVVRIRDGDGGEGRYHFRLSWQMDGGGYGRDGGSYPDDRRRGGYGVRGFDEFMRATGRVLKSGAVLRYGPGRHGPLAQNTFSYFFDPNGHVGELCTAMEQIPVEGGRPPRVVDPAVQRDEWGTARTVAPDAVPAASLIPDTGHWKAPPI
jgi:hypothetical protein